MAGQQTRWRAASRASASTHTRAATKHARAGGAHLASGESRLSLDTHARSHKARRALTRAVRPYTQGGVTGYGRHTPPPLRVVGEPRPQSPHREKKAPRTRVRKTRHDDALSKWVEDLHTQEDRRRTARYRRRPEAASRARVSEAGCAGRVTQSRKSPMRRNGRRAGTPIELCRQALAERCRRAHWLQTPPAIDGREFAAPSTG